MYNNISGYYKTFEKRLLFLEESDLLKLLKEDPYLERCDILILDEVLSVGDGAFAAKSAKKMREIITSGTTTVFVSHSLNHVRKICNKCLWLDHGRQIAFGETQEICYWYRAFLKGEVEL